MLSSVKKSEVGRCQVSSYPFDRVVGGFVESFHCPVKGAKRALTCDRFGGTVISGRSHNPDDLPFSIYLFPSLRSDHVPCVVDRVFTLS